ncbi:hypothetical protein D3C76_1116810 [compost metagenome]
MCKAIVDALLKVAAQLRTELSQPGVATDQLRTRDQDGIHVSRGTGLHRVSLYQAVQGGFDVLPLASEGIGAGDGIKHPDIQLYGSGVARQQIARASGGIACQRAVLVRFSRKL